MSGAEGGAGAGRRFDVRGEAGESVRLNVADLGSGRPGHRAEAVFDCATSGPRHHTSEGPLQRDVLLGVCPGSAPGSRKDRAGLLLAVGGADGHHAVLAWAEVDEEFRYAPVLLAVRLDGALLDAPHLVVPADRCGARYVSAVTAVRLVRLGGPVPVTGEAAGVGREVG
ncbi:molybdopterin-dependent oxidoreductase [Streptomyces sp. NPDC058374]|uniref:molybdopterin-dependent oxidoreductase n=1 Tax=Streptomyces sp. NPDC058374 TaxID=3346466 RepID=UPI00365B14D9